MQQCFRQLEEKNLPSEVHLMQWSPKMDLIALANKNGEVILQRLTWQKQPIWTLPSIGDEEGKDVTGLAWRPDGKVLSVGYKNGKLLLCSVEGARIIHSQDMGHPVTCMQWVITKATEGMQTGQYEEGTSLYQDGSDNFLPPLPSLSKVSKAAYEEDAEDVKKLKDQKQLNLLLVGLENGLLHLLAFGIAPVAEVDLNSKQSTGICGKIVSAVISQDAHYISLLAEHSADDSTEMKTILVPLDAELLSSRHSEIAKYAIKYGKITALMEYLEATLKAVIEAKEDILLEIETKFTKYAEQKGTEGTVSDEFLELLIWGKASLELQTFLLQELTEKGLKKLGHSVENSYSSIQKLILKHIHSVCRAILFHLSEVHGMSKWYDKFGILGLSPDATQAAMTAVGSFLLKANELLQVIENSLKNFKAFFRWLYVQMMHMLEEPVSEAISKMYQKDINFVADFLEENFAEDVSKSKSGFTLERVSQYFRDEDLFQPLTNSNNVWLNFLESNPEVSASPLIYPNQRDKSLIQLHNNLVEAVNAALSRTGKMCGQSISVRNMFPLFKTPPPIAADEKKPKRIQTISQHSSTDGQSIFTIAMATSSPSDVIYFIRQSAGTDRSSYGCDVLQLRFSCLGEAHNQSIASTSSEIQKCQRYQILDAVLYDEHTMSVLLHEEDEELPDRVSVLCQLPLAAITKVPVTDLTSFSTLISETDAIASLDAGPLVSHFHRLDNLRASRFAVSGSRKVACVLFSNCRRVRLFDMDAEDEEEDTTTLDSTMNTSRAVDESLQDVSIDEFN